MSVDNFVRIYDNVMSKDICDVYINLFQKAKEASMVQDAGLTDTERKDSSFLLCDVNLDANNDFNLMLNDYVNQYNNDFSILNQYKMISYLNKMQETEIGGGYHLWHNENNNVTSFSRILTWLFYFNDVEEGGETELLYQHMRVKPQAGRLVIFPAYFTHTHRGNPPISNTKYIATGWYHLVE
jgi:hypothetical protein